jgi:hypothetical protein
MKVEYDPKCEELARWFLDEEYGLIYHARLVNVLAGVIQTAIEGWFEARGTGRNIPWHEGEERGGGKA